MVSFKSYRPKEVGGSGPDGGGELDFKGERRSNDTHQSTTDPDAGTKLKRKSLGKEARLCFAAHALVDNRHGLITDISVCPSVGVSEPHAALELLARPRRKRIRPKSVGADKSYHTYRFFGALRFAHSKHSTGPTIDLQIKLTL